MTVGLVLKIILAVMEAVPMVNSWVQQILEGILLNKIKDITNKYSDLDKKHSAILMAIKEAKTNEQKVILFSALNDLK